MNQSAQTISEIETWRPIPGYEGLYEISSSGTVLSLHRVVIRKNGAKCTVKERIIKQRKDWDAPTHCSVSVQITKAGVCESFRVAYLVLLAFVGPRPFGQVVRHLDDDPDNNHISNLAWGTQKENVWDSVRNGRGAHRFGEGNPGSKLTEDEVRDIKVGVLDLGLTKGAKHFSIKFGVCTGTIYSIAAGLSWKHVR